MIRGEIPPQQNVSKDFFLKCECVPKKTIMKSTLIRVLYKQFSQDDLLRYFEIQANWFFPFKKKFDLQINLDFVCTFTKCLFDVVCFIGQGPLYKWTEHSLKLYFWNYKVGGAPTTPRGWMGVDGMDLDHKITQNIHIKIFLMRGQKKFWVQ